MAFPGSVASTGDDDVYTRYTYSAGRMATVWVDVDGDGTVDTGDQVTTYSYGPTKGTGTADSFVKDKRLLANVLYPAQGFSGETTWNFNATAWGPATGATMASICCSAACIKLTACLNTPGLRMCSAWFIIDFQACMAGAFLVSAPGEERPLADIEVLSKRELSNEMAFGIGS